MNKKTTLLCVCGKLCFSKPGLVNHQKKCREALDAAKSGSTASKKVVIDGMEYVKDVKEFILLAEEIAIDAHSAITIGNKSAARRARVSLNLLKHKIFDMRKTISNKVKVKNG